MTDPTSVAQLVDDAVAAVPGVEQLYVAAPALTVAVETVASRRSVHAHVTVLPRAIRTAIGVRDDADSRAIAAHAAAAARAALPDDWAQARVHVQVRRIE